LSGQPVYAPREIKAIKQMTHSLHGDEQVVLQVRAAFPGIE